MLALWVPEGAEGAGHGTPGWEQAAGRPSPGCHWAHCGQACISFCFPNMGCSLAQRETQNSLHRKAVCSSNFPFLPTRASAQLEPQFQAMAPHFSPLDPFSNPWPGLGGPGVRDHCII